MNRSRWRTALAAAVLVLLPIAAAQAAEAIRWQTNFTAAKVAAKKSHRLMLVDFYAEW